jgi:hypothetical protein
MWKFSRTKDERMGIGIVYFRSGFPQPSCNKREQASHFLFCIYPSPIVKKELAENPEKSRYDSKLSILWQ